MSYLLFEERMNSEEYGSMGISLSSSACAAFAAASKSASVFFTQALQKDNIFFDYNYS